jgi:predicted kinase
MLEKFGSGQFDLRQMKRLAASTDDHLRANARLLDRRRDDGRVRRAHGDLHLRNIVLLDGKPTPFDCIEFNDDFAIIDILYDLAFLLMDLDHRGLRGLANAVLNRTIDLSGDVDGLACLPLFLSMRAAVRAHVDAAQTKFDEGKAYLDLAVDYLTPKPVRLIAVGGLSGSGKSSLARLIAPAIGRAPGAVVLRSDATRKRLAGVGLYEKLPSDAYTKEMSDRVYARLLLDAERALLDGHSVILDAVNAHSDERDQANNLAHKLEVPFTGLWLDVPLSVRQDRIGGRKRDVSDATAEVAKAQDSYDLGPMDWHILDAGQDLETVTAQAETIL